MGTDAAACIDAAFALVLDDPGSAEALASGLIDGPEDLPTRAAARWARGMARRERGATDLGAEDLLVARTEATDAGEPELAARIDVTRAMIVFHAQSAGAALAMLDEAEHHLRGNDLARLETQRGLILHRVGDLDAAERLYRRAQRRFAGAAVTDGVGRVRLLSNLAVLLAQRGELAAADECATQAYELSGVIGQRYLAAASLHNRGYGRARIGRLSESIDDIRAAEDEYLALGRHDLVHIARADLAEVLLSANLLDEAADVADRAVAGVRVHGTDTDVADASLLAARCRLAVGRTDDALDAARESVALLERQQRSSLLAVAEYVAMSVGDGAAAPSEVAAALDELAVRLRDHGWWLETTGARVRAAAAWLRAGDAPAATATLASLGPTRRLPAAERAAVALARGMIAEAGGDRRTARRSITAGLRIVSENQGSVASFELRAFAAGHGEALRRLGANLAIADRRPRELLVRLEATRGRMITAGTGDLVDDVLDGMLQELRDTTEELRAAGAAGRPAEGLRRRQVELEQRVRDRTRRVGALGKGVAGSVEDAIAALGDRCLLEYAVVDRQLWAVTVRSGRASLHDLGDIAGLREDVEACSFALAARLNRAGGSNAARAAAAATLAALAGELRDRLVPSPIAARDAALVVVPDDVLHGVAWRTVAGVGARPVSVAPSLVGWAAAAGRARPEVARANVALVAGPDLPGADVEVDAIATVYDHPIVLTGPSATVGAVLGGIATTDVAHLACHGTFRTDNPLFSTLAMVDGRITVHDLQGRGPLPGTVVLSACSVASAGPLRGGTLLGLSSALMSFGVANVVAPLTPVNDERVVDSMVELHRALAAGVSPPHALAAVAGGDHLDPTAAPFLALGA